MYKQSQLSLTEADITKIKKIRNLPIIIIVVANIPISILILVAGENILWSSLIVLAINIIMFIPIVFIYKKGDKDLKAGYKNHIVGQVEKKEMVSTGKSNTPYVTIGERKVIVNYADYNTIQVGDEIEVEFTAHSGHALRFNKK
jgi:hypothetical protein